MSTPLVDGTVAAPLRPAQIKVQDAALAVQPVLVADQPDFAQMVLEISRPPKGTNATQAGDLPTATTPSNGEQQDTSQEGRGGPDAVDSNLQPAATKPDNHFIKMKQHADTSKDPSADFTAKETAAVDAPPKSRPTDNPLQAGALPQVTDKSSQVAEQTPLRKTSIDQRPTIPNLSAPSEPTQKVGVSDHPVSKPTKSGSVHQLPPNETIQQTLMSNPAQTVQKSPRPDTESKARTQMARPVVQHNTASHVMIPDAEHHAPQPASGTSDDIGTKGLSPNAAQLITPAKPAANHAQPPATLQAKQPVNGLLETPPSVPRNDAPLAPPAEARVKGTAIANNETKSAPQTFVSPKQATVLGPSVSPPPKGFLRTAPEPQPQPQPSSIQTKAIPSPSTQLFTLVAGTEPASPVLQNSALPVVAPQTKATPTPTPDSVLITQPGTAQGSDIFRSTHAPHVTKSQSILPSDQRQAQNGPLLTAHALPKTAPIKAAPQTIDHATKPDPALTLLVPSSEGGEMLHWDPARASPTGTANPVRSDLTPHIARQMVEVFPQAAHRPVEIALSPQELGRVRMSITTDDGAVTVNILAERADTLDLMRRNIEQLGQSFRSMGYDQITFSFGQGMDSDGQGDGPEQNNPQPADLNGSDTENAPARTDINDPALRIQTTGIDIRL